MEGMGLPTGFGNSSKATHETKTAKKPMSIRLKTKDTTGFGTSTAGNAPAADQMGSRTSNTHGSSSSGESDEDDDTGAAATKTSANCEKEYNNIAVYVRTSKLQSVVLTLK